MMNNRQLTIDLSERELPLRTIFWGYHNTGMVTYRCLKKSAIFKLIAVVLPDSRKHVTIEQIKRNACQSNIDVFSPSNLQDVLLASKLKTLAPDIYLVDSYTKLIPSQLLEIVYPLGFNIHPGFLPEYRGAHTTNWALINNERRIGVTMHLLSDKFDDGEIIDSRVISCHPLDDINDIDRKIVEVIPLLMECLTEQISKKIIDLKRPQGQMHYYNARKPEDGFIDKSLLQTRVYNMVRALTYPWPGAFIIKNNRKLILWKAFPVDIQVDKSPGSIIRKDDSVFYVAGDRKLLLIVCINDPVSKDFSPKSGKDILELLFEYEVECIEYGTIC